RTDLYAWAAIAYSLLSGDRPVQLALTQGQPWAHFGEPQFALLEQALRRVPPAQVGGWGEQLGVDAAALTRSWPRNLLIVLHLGLRPDPRQRPASVADLLSWLMAPPPPPVAAALALHFPDQRPVKVFVDIRMITPGLDLLVRRSFGSPPSTAQE